MPPWKADDRHSKLKNYNSLTDEQREAIKNWVTNGMPQGKEEGIPVEKTVSKSHTVGHADLVLSMKQSFTIRDNFTATAQVFVLPVDLAKDQLISAIEFVPGNKKIVKSCTVSIDTGQTGLRYDSNDLGYGYRSLTGIGFIPYQYNWFQWSADDPPGVQLLTVPKKIPAGSRLLLHISYTASITNQQDSSCIKFQFAETGTGQRVVSSDILFDTSHITNGPFVINKGEKKKFFSVNRLSKTAEIHSIMPMGQNALSGWEIYGEDSLTGRRIELLKIPYWDAHWKKKYVLEKPVQFSAGSKIYGIAYYNNSDDNPNLIILPPKKIQYGEGQRDELFVVQFDVVYKER